MQWIEDLKPNTLVLNIFTIHPKGHCMEAHHAHDPFHPVSIGVKMSINHDAVAPMF